jgi:hypothetical protein
VEKIESPASRERLEALWLNLLTVLESSIKADQGISVEMLNCARLFLKDNNNSKPTPEQREQLQALHGLLSAKLLEVMNSKEGPSSTSMETIRRFLADNHITKDIAQVVDVRSGLEILQDLSLPFQQH